MNKLKSILLAVVFMFSAGAMAIPSDLLDPDMNTKSDKKSMKEIACEDYLGLDYFEDKCGIQPTDDSTVFLISGGFEVTVIF